MSEVDDLDDLVALAVESERYEPRQSPSSPYSPDESPAPAPAGTDGETLLAGVLRDLTGGGPLSEWQQSVIASLRKHGLHENDPSWLLVLPGLLGSAPAEMVREAIGRNGSSAAALPDKQLQKLAEGVAARIVIEPPDIDVHIIADLVGKRLTPVVRASLADTPAPIQAPAPASDNCKHMMLEALLNRNMAIAVLAGVLVSAMAWFGGSIYRGSIDDDVIQNLERQVQVLQKENAALVGRGVRKG